MRKAADFENHGESDRIAGRRHGDPETASTPRILKVLQRVYLLKLFSESDLLEVVVE
jgi:hypothetical protein